MATLLSLDPLATPSVCPAHILPPQQRQQLALDALAGQPISQLARQHQVSRKFVYQQAHRARHALHDAFEPPAPPPEKVLFDLPVTKTWLDQFVLALVLIAHCSFRGVQELLRDLFDTSLALGTIHNLVRQAVVPARVRNAQQDLSPIQSGAHDELFQSRWPVLVGVDVASTYCYLLSQEEHRDATTWGVRLLELRAQGFCPETTIADAAAGLRAGQMLALPGVPCRGDVFHAERELGQLAAYLDNRAYGLLSVVDKLQRRIVQNPQRGVTDSDLVQRCANAQTQAAASVTLADDVAVLARWLREDVLAVVGPPLADRYELFDFVVGELRQREPSCEHRIAPVARALSRQRDELLAFVADLDRDLSSWAGYHRLPMAVARDLWALQGLSTDQGEYWRRAGRLRSVLGERWGELNGEMEELASGVVRASSVVENLNSRLRSYFFLRRHLGSEYLELLRFFLNHRRFMRSEHADRVGKSPAELLSGEEQPHWLEQLGYCRFRRAG